MLTIQNIDKILGQLIYKEWYVKNMNGMIQVLNLNGLHKELYNITIQNAVSGSEGTIYLDRMESPYGGWYELYCNKGGTKNVQLITKDTIKDIKELLEYIKIIAIDTQYT